jgi:hypothetical protein
VIIRAIGLADDDLSQLQVMRKELSRGADFSYAPCAQTSEVSAAFAHATQLALEASSSQVKLGDSVLFERDAVDSATPLHKTVVDTTWSLAGHLQEFAVASASGGAITEQQAGVIRTFSDDVAGAIMTMRSGNAALRAKTTAAAAAAAVSTTAGQDESMRKAAELAAEARDLLEKHRAVVTSLSKSPALELFPSSAAAVATAGTSSKSSSLVPSVLLDIVEQALLDTQLMLASVERARDATVSDKERAEHFMGAASGSVSALNIRQHQVAGAAARSAMSPKMRLESYVSDESNVEFEKKAKKGFWRNQ